MDQLTSWSLKARWIITMDGPPLRDATVVVQGERIAEVRAERRPQAEIDFGNAAILPGFVNCHTHLDLTGAHGKCPVSTDFTSWLKKVIAYRRTRTEDELKVDIQAGIAQSIQHGVTLIGDISSGGSSWRALADAEIRSVVFLELLGLTEERASQAWRDAIQWLQRHRSTKNTRAGLSPHAPYSVRNILFQRVASIDPELPIAIHLAETEAEMQLIAEQEGPFKQFLKKIGVWDPSGLVESLDQLLELYQLNRTLWVHGNYLDPDLYISPKGTFVYCPRTHAAFGHPPYPFLSGAHADLRFVLGTDSLASNPDLSILNEIRYLYAQHARLDPARLLHAATLKGARALGWGEETGSITAGKTADLVVIPLPGNHGKNPYDQVLDSDLPVSHVLFRGQWVHKDEQ